MFEYQIRQVSNVRIKLLILQVGEHHEYWSMAGAQQFLSNLTMWAENMKIGHRIVPVFLYILSIHIHTQTHVVTVLKLLSQLL